MHRVYCSVAGTNERTERIERMNDDIRTAIVTGGSRGIGAAIAKGLEGNGCTVRRPLRKELDLSDVSAVRAWAESDDTVPDALVLNAGENIPTPLEEMTTEHWQRTLDVNLNSCFELIRVYGPRMAARGRGRIVAISSFLSFRGRVGRGPYSASKAALDALIRVAALEYGPSGVLANAVCPGFVMTDLTRQNNDEATLEHLASTTALRRLGTPEEVAELVVFLAGDRNTYVTGQTLVIDGGYTCQ